MSDAPPSSAGPERAPIESTAGIKDEAAGAKRNPGRPRKDGSSAQPRTASAGAGPTEPPPIETPEFTVQNVFDMFGRPIRLALVAFDCADPAVTDEDLLGWASASTAFFNKYRNFLLCEITMLLATGMLVGPRIAKKISKVRAAGAKRTIVRPTVLDGGNTGDTSQN